MSSASSHGSRAPARGGSWSRGRSQQSNQSSTADRSPSDDPTFESVAREWNDQARWVVAHSERIISRLERDVFPVIGSRQIADIEAPEVLDVVREVEARGALERDDGIWLE